MFTATRWSEMQAHRHYGAAIHKLCSSDTAPSTPLPLSSRPRSSKGLDTLQFTLRLPGLCALDTLDAALAAMKATPALLRAADSTRDGHVNVSSTGYRVPGAACGTGCGAGLAGCGAGLAGCGTGLAAG